MVRGRSRNKFIAAAALATVASAMTASVVSGQSLLDKTPAPSGQSVVSTASVTALGDYLIDGEGRSLYMFTPDKDGKPTCYDACAKSWPAFLTERTAKASGEAETEKLGTTERDDGALQVTYGGHPLYYFVTDADAGSVAGQAVHSFEGVWYLLGPEGEPIKAKRPGEFPNPGALQR